MSDDSYCIAGIAIATGGLVIMALILRGMPRPQIFTGWVSIVAAWRQTRGVAEKMLLVFVLSRQLSRGLAISFVIAAITAAATIGASICGLNPESMKVIRATIGDILRWLRGEPAIHPGQSGA